MEPGGIRSVERGDLAALDLALRSLSRELGDPHIAGLAELDRALFGAPPSAWAMVADGPDGLAGVAGAVLFAPVFSTVRGGAGVFVSDLWVADSGRGGGTGADLLRAVAEAAGALWDARFMRLSVHDHNRRARSFYRKLGFSPADGEALMTVTGQAFQQMRRTT